MCSDCLHFHFPTVSTSASSVLCFTSCFLRTAQLSAVAELTERSVGAAGCSLLRVYAGCADAKEREKKKRRRLEGKSVLSGPLWEVC